VRDGGAVIGARELCEAFRLHRRLLAAAAGRVLGGHDDVDDLLQDVFVEALRGVHAVREAAALRAWLVRVTVRAALRRRGAGLVGGRRRAQVFVGIDDAPAAAQVVDPRASAHDLALLRDLGELMARIPADRSRPWAMRTLDGEPIEDIAVRCGCSRTTVKRRIAEVQGILDAALAEPPGRHAA
jgi:RNA polymerase sigma-70 factor (ECF subfamily)